MTEQATDDEFGAPEEVPVDINRQIHHLMQSFSADNINLHWKIGQHAAEIDWLKQKLAEKEQEVEALNIALQAETEHAEDLQRQLDTSRSLADHYADELERLQDAPYVELPRGKNSTMTQMLSGADDPQPVDAFLAMASGQPGLASDSPDDGR